MRRQFLSGLAGLAAAAAAAPVLAQARGFPTRPVRVIVPFPAGGSFDLFARAIQPRLSAGLGQPIVIENRGGASGTIGVEAIARAAPDGHTIGLAAASTHTVPLALGMKLPYNPLRDFTPLSLLVRNPICIVAHPAVPARNLRELVAHARARPDALFYGSSGTGSFLHLVGEMFNQVANVRITHVPYKGGADQITSVLGGQTQLSYLPVQIALPHVKSGKLRVIALMDPQRHPSLPDVEAVQEVFAQFTPRMSWIAAFAPAGVPREIAQQLQQELVKTLKDPDVVRMLDANVLVPVGGTPDELARLLSEDVDAWGDLVRKAGIKVQL